MDPQDAEVEQAVSTGSLPGRERVGALVLDAYERAKAATGGTVAGYIPALAGADPELFGVSVAGVDGRVHAAGDAAVPFTIQSVSKAFVYALVCEALGHRAVAERVGVDNTGLAFDSVIAIELNGGSPMNPMVNAGAIATTALVPGSGPAGRWEAIRAGLSAFAGRPLALDEEVYDSEAATNRRNQAIARLLQSHGRLDADPPAAVDLYTRQCALLVSARDLAVMGATLADGGTNPVTGRRVVSPEVCRDTLAVLAANGMYQRSGEWLFEIGLPAKSGVSGGIVAVAPGKGAIGTFAPRLDAAGNSVRGRHAVAHLSRTLGLNLFASRVHAAAG
ncbi:glutaminase A [Actinomadura parmotrematis]|uniref:Glutaminase n=1 Tax=Actinomadura parmotrematis TaxID=2864039 RepID=A0ABS7G523_9ACTN|nr:glutaminase A [Actinomadura parmotrematis]MBW8487480.1 glutaminase A [Actinomadura parmotrematis]